MTHLRTTIALMAIAGLISACSGSRGASTPTAPTPATVATDNAGTVGSLITATPVVGVVSGVTGACPTISFKMGTTTVVTNASTTFRLACGDVKNGVTIALVGIRQADGTVLAKGIAPAPVATPRPSPSGPITMVGEVSGLSGTCPALTFTLANGTKVITNAATKFHVACAEIRNGDHVGIKATRQADGSVLALEVARPSALSRPRTVTGVVAGFVKTNCPAVTFTIAGKKVATSASTRFEGKACTAIVDGDTAVAAGTVRADGVLQAIGLKTR
jgi:hypothetical protein